MDKTFQVLLSKAQNIDDLLRYENSPDFLSELK